ncbi:MAG: hypothetical protein ACR2OZ_04435 [Verrucomicrobiales bacterium]
MRSLRFPPFRVLALLLLISPASAVITINGVSNRSYYANSVTFTVPPAAGFTIVSQLDGQTIDASAGYTARAPSYHELYVTKTPNAGGPAETALVQFIIRDSARNGGRADTGLPSWVPVDQVDAPLSVLASATLRVVVPRRVPVGITVPVIYRLTEANGQIAKLMGTALTQDTGPSENIMRHRVWRGAGCGQFPAYSAAGDHTLSFGWNNSPLQTSSVTSFSVTDPADTLTGTLAADFTNSQNLVNVTGNVTVPAGRTLRLTAGTVVRLSAGVEFDVKGSLIIEGTPQEPVFFCPASAGQRWGGIWANGTAAQLQITGGIFTGGCASANWLSQAPHNFGGHHADQPIITLSNLAPDAIATLTDVYIVDNAPGQAFHTEASNMTLTRCLVQRATTGGQCDNGSIKVIESHFVEMNLANGIFEDDDNDGLYLTGGAHEMRRSVWCYCKDDGLDAGSGPGGTMLVEDCWIESCFHEGMAWSNEGSTARVVTVNNTVSLNNGQGVECGFGASSNGPQVTVTGSLLSENAVGARFGDNYDWDYPGHLTVRDSYILYNRFHDVWGMNWDDWTYRAQQMTIENNVITEPNSFHPDNTLYVPPALLPGIAPLVTAPQDRRGVGVVGRPRQNGRSAYGGFATVRLDRPATSEVRLPWKVVARTAYDDGLDIDVATGEAIFNPGESARQVTLPALAGAAASAPWVVFKTVIGEGTPLASVAEFTGNDSLHFTSVQTEGGDGGITLIPRGAQWRFYDAGDIGAAPWTTLGYNDSGWGQQAAPLGWGNGQQPPLAEGRFTYYFRRKFTVDDPGAFSNVTINLLRDDGAVIYINGAEVWRSNMPDSGPITYLTPASVNNLDENVWHTDTELPSVLQSGENIIAVEVHQRNASSSDINFDLELIGNPPPPPGGFNWEAASLDGAVYLMWHATGITVTPQQSDDLVTWTYRPDLQSPLRVNGSGQRAFFRLKSE